jgi:hypothetical protein
MDRYVFKIFVLEVILSYAWSKIRESYTPHCSWSWEGSVCSRSERVPKGRNCSREKGVGREYC